MGTQYVVKPNEHINQLSSWYFQTKKVWKTLRWRGAQLISLPKYFGHRRAKCCSTAKKINMDQQTHYLGVCTKFDHGCRKWVWFTPGCKVCQSNPTAMKVTVDVSRHPTGCIYQISNWYFKTWRKNLESIPPSGNLAELPLPSALAIRGKKKCPISAKISRSQDTHYRRVCTKSWRLCINFEAMNAEKI